MPSLQLIEQFPSVDDYLPLRAAVGWGIPDREATAHSIQNTLYGMRMLDGEKIVGCGRVIGDGALYYYVQDIIVLPAYQGQGYGRQIMESIMRYLTTNLRPGAFVGLMAAKGVAGFYLKYGFIERPTDQYGPGMMLLWK